MWVVGDLFQNYAAKYVGISRGIPLSNTNQLWGLLWGTLVFGELHGLTRGLYAQVIGGSLLMAAGAVAIAFSSATEGEYSSWKEAAQRESDLYNIEPAYVAARMEGKETEREEPSAHLDRLAPNRRGHPNIRCFWSHGQHSRNGNPLGLARRAHVSDAAGLGGRRSCSLAYHTVQLGALFARRKGESILFQISTLSTAPCRARLSCSSVGSPYATCSCHISCAPFSNSRSSFSSHVWLIPSCRAISASKTK